MTLEPRGAVIAPRGDDGLGRHQSRFDRRPNAFAALRIREPGGVAGEQHAIIDYTPAALGREQVRVAAPFVFGASRNAAARGEEVHELGRALRQRALVETAKADVDVAALPKAPAVALQIRAEIQLR